MTNPPVINVWQSKPGWCQPWTILLTGITVIGGSWLLLHRWWITLPLSLLISVWWTYFLVLYPRLVNQAYQASLASSSTPDLD